LNYDVYMNEDEVRVYMTAEQEAAPDLNRLYEHRVNPSAPEDNVNGFSFDEPIGSVCGSEVFATDSIVVIACKKTN